MSLEDQIEELGAVIGDLTAALNLQTQTILSTIEKPVVEESVVEKPVAEKPKVKPVASKKPVAPAPVEKEAPAPVPNNKPPMHFDTLRLRVLKWIGPLVKSDKEQAQKVMKKLLDKYTGGKEFTVENLPAKYYQNVVDYITTVEAK